MEKNTFIFNRIFSDKNLGGLLQSGLTIENTHLEEKNVVILDTFNEALRRRNMILLQSRKKIMLIDCSTGKLISQQGIAEFLCPPDLNEGAVKDVLCDISRLRALLPGSKIIFSAAVKNILDDERKTVARLKCFTFQKGKRSASLIIGQPLRGYERQYRMVMDAAAKGGPQKSGPKSTLLFDILKIKGSNYNPKPALALDRNQPIIAAANRIAAVFIGLARRNEDGIIADYDTEFLHDYRVSLRKVRSAVNLFNGIYHDKTTAYLKDELSSLMQATGRMRDLDVYLLDRQHYFSLVPAGSHEGLEIMFAAFARERLDLHKTLCKRLTSIEYNQGIEALEAGFADNKWLPGILADQPSHLFACRLILKRYKKICRIARRITAETPDETVHKLRIHCKKLRYLMEFFVPFFDRKKIRALIKSLKVLQDNLGRFNDYSVQQIFLADFLKQNHFRGSKNIKVAESIGALTAMLNLLQKEERAKVMDNFARFDSPDTRLLFSQLFSSQAKGDDK